MPQKDEQSGPGPEPPPGPPGPPDPAAWRPWLLPLAIFTILAFWLARTGAPDAPEELPYSEFKAMVRLDQVRSVSLRGSRIDGERTGVPSAAGAGTAQAHFRTRLPSIGDDELMHLLEEHSVAVVARADEAEGFWPRLLSGLAPWIIVFGLYFWLLRPLSRNLPGGLGRGGDLGGFLKRGASPQQSLPETRFDDVAGQESAKNEVAELVDFLRAPDRYRALGASVPRGVLLMGPPGTGKTLMARALAGEAGVPFFSISASEFIEVFVGVGASRVRELFQSARKAAPSILFIDELDSIGRVRGAGLGGGHDEREQTLNQILAELDGFAAREAVIVLAATNRPDVLDPALLRPGRFDRHIQLDLPDKNARRAILDIHVREVPLGLDVDLDALASGTPGFSGADLKNLVNEAAMRAARLGHVEVSREDFDSMRDRVLIGAERKLLIQPDERHRLAVHESGHAVAARYLPHADPLYKVSIIPRGRALGGTQQLPEAERYTPDEDYLKDRLAVLLAGRAAERLLLDSVSAGAEDDIHQATALARAMVTRWGMAGDIGPIDLRDSEEHPFLGREIAQPRHHSEASARAVDEAVKALVAEADARTLELLREHRDGLERLVAELERTETLDRGGIEGALEARSVSILRPGCTRPKAAG